MKMGLSGMKMEGVVLWLKGLMGVEGNIGSIGGGEEGYDLVFEEGVSGLRRLIRMMIGMIRNGMSG